MIYIASPYTAGEGETSRERELMELRYRSALRYSAELQKKERFCISAIAHWHRAAGLFRLPKKAEFWLEYNYELLDRCEEMHILMLPGWEESYGVSQERAYAKKEGIPIDFAEPSNNELERQTRLLKRCKNSA